MSEAMTKQERVERGMALFEEVTGEHGRHVMDLLADTSPQLDVHINAALRVGLKPEEIVEAILHASIFCGIPRAINATLAAKKVFAEQGLLPVES